MAKKPTAKKPSAREQKLADLFDAADALTSAMHGLRAQVEALQGDMDYAATVERIQRAAKDDSKVVLLGLGRQTKDKVEVYWGRRTKKFEKDSNKEGHQVGYAYTRTQVEAVIINPYVSANSDLVPIEATSSADDNPNPTAVLVVINAFDKKCEIGKDANTVARSNLLKAAIRGDGPVTWESALLMATLDHGVGTKAASGAWTTMGTNTTWRVC